MKDIMRMFPYAVMRFPVVMIETAFRREHRVLFRKIVLACLSDPLSVYKGLSMIMIGVALNFYGLGAVPMRL